ncbi:methylthioadenosine phosphorylase [Sulfobacillus acidophilus TPY]|uniref:Probable 6-oxopurine nucleoside phosphorylase n=1 Tax=Sulfobacillus acidophilus (strain ATCC 700253 / DSM 10332 / NAL) TaxID=679936 RepID=G8U1D1_SULAD|nr:methylthioadenosine phosphorylase [Sulfobacillus acidophilus TPY]AEW05451.1 methylthioadenosine phosphorylase [Sulfobacillus acidophilus DSM 10332]
MNVAVIGGTGVYDPAWMLDAHTESVATPYGEALVTRGRLASAPDLSIIFLNRHGTGHALPPHRVNYRANIWALKALGVDRVVATAAVGSLNQAMAPGHFVLVDQFLDFTKSRPSTFFEGGEAGVVHTDMTEPYCGASRHRLSLSAAKWGIPLVNGGVYVTTEGPRFESAAEIRAFKLLGGDVVGMTGVPEVVLAREAGMCYTAIALVTNYAAGLAGQPLTHQEVLDVMKQQSERLRQLLAEGLPRLAETYACDCPTPEMPLIP